MDTRRLDETIKKISEPDREAMEKARIRQDQLAKVPGSLGRLEDISVRIAGISGKPCGTSVSRQAIVLMCADNGVVEEGVASAPQSVTMSQTVNFTRGITGVSSQARYFGIDLLVLDVGVKLPIPDVFYAEDMLENGRLQTRIVNRRIGRGTRNFNVQPAMTEEQALRAVEAGIEAADAAKAAGIELLGVGEMGIGNTTTASACLAAMTGLSAEKLVSRGGGLNDAGMQKKIEIVDRAGKKYRSASALDILAGIGGFDICAMAGCYLGAAANRIPVVIDGFISIAAACLAAKLCPAVTGYMFASHKSTETGYLAAVDMLGLQPMFDLYMRLGEGSGCPIAFKVIEAAMAAMNGMKTLDEAQIDWTYLEERKKGNFLD